MRAIIRTPRKYYEEQFYLRGPPDGDVPAYWSRRDRDWHSGVHRCKLAGMPKITAAKRSRTKPSKRDKRLGPVLVSGVRLAVHLGCVRQNIDHLAAQGVVARNQQGLFDQDQSRLRYIQHLRAERAHSPRTAVDAEHVKAKTAVLNVKLAVARRDLVHRAEVDDLIERLCGIVLTALSSMPAQCAPTGDLITRRRIEAAVFRVRKQLAEIALEMAKDDGEPPSQPVPANGGDMPAP